MTTEAKQRITAIRERVEKATPEPWCVDDGHSRYQWRVYCDDSLGSQVADCTADVCPLITDAARTANAAFIANAREDVPFLLDRIVVLEKLLERAAMFIDQHVSHEMEGCPGDFEDLECTCGKRAILAEIDSQFTRSDA